MAKVKLTVNVQNVDNTTELIAALEEARHDIEQSVGVKHTGRKGLSVTDFVCKWTIGAHT